MYGSTIYPVDICEVYWVFDWVSFTFFAVEVARTKLSRNLPSPAEVNFGLS